MLFFHLSRKDLGQKFKFEPKIPESALISKEGNIPRVCVCSEIFYCMRAIVSSKVLLLSSLFLEFEETDKSILPFTVYATKRIPFLPPAASDFRRNKEHWYLTPVVMERLGYVDLHSLFLGKIVVSKEYKTLPRDFKLNPEIEVLIKRSKATFTI